MTRSEIAPPTGLYVGGTWQQGAELLDVVDPSSGDPFSQVSRATVEDCLRAVDAAATARSAWAARPPRERSEILRRAWELLIEEQDRFARLIVRENGKTLADARAEVGYAAEFFRWFSEEAVRIHGDMRRSPSGSNWIMVTREPAGVALLITPWNYPAAMATRKIAPALAGGCTVVLKPAAETPLTALALADLLDRAGVPPGVVNVVVPSPAGPAVDAMLADERIRVLSFTGSTEVGRLLLERAARRVIRCSMELGGNAPFLVLEDADLDEAVEGLLVAKLRNGGSACTAANRVYVADAIYDEFVDRFTSRIRDVRVGSGLADGVGLGPLINERTRHDVERLVAGAVDQGATAVVGDRGPGGGGFYYPPTVLADVPRDASILNEEIFGPVAPIVRFSDVDQAVADANDVDAGLVAYVYTRRLDLGLELSRRLEAGMVGLNRGLVSDPAAPFGGVKESGLGREGASHGIEEFLEVKYTALPYS